MSGFHRKPILTLFRVFGLASIATFLHLYPSYVLADAWDVGVRGFNVHPDISASELAEVSKLGANVVRLSFDTIPLVEEKFPHRINMNAIEQLDRILADCELYGIKVIIDAHTVPGLRSKFTTFPDDELWKSQYYQGILIELWGYLASKYKSHNKTLLAYDILNEPSMPRGYEKWQIGDWNVLANKIVAEIRKYDEARFIIVEPAVKFVKWGQTNTRAESMLDLEFIDSPNIVYSPHIYVPLQYTHQGVMSGAKVGTQYPGYINGKYWDKETLKNALAPIMEFQKKHNAEIFIGEFSVSNLAPNNGYQYLIDVLEIMEDQKWGWTYHDFKGSAFWDPQLGSNVKEAQVLKSGNTPPQTRLNLLTHMFSKNIESDNLR
jgi:endoglucanase